MPVESIYRATAQEDSMIDHTNEPPEPDHVPQPDPVEVPEPEEEEVRLPPREKQPPVKGGTGAAPE